MFAKLDENFNKKELEGNLEYIDFSIEECYNIFSSSFIYDKINNKYSMAISCQFNAKLFKISNIEDLSTFESQLNSEESESYSILDSASLESYASTQTEISNDSPTPLLNIDISTSMQNSSEIIPIYKINYLSIYSYNDIIRATTNKTKEEIEDCFKEIIDAIEIRKKYEIKGIDYNISISPLNIIDTYKTSYVELSIYEQILRKQYDLSDDEVLTILQIEIERKNEKALTNQIEYEIYIENKTKLDLSYCNNVSIKIKYEIKKPSLLNKDMISHYSDMNIDIFNIEDQFFNDICIPFSNENSDIILKDRILDIYQNYSLCDNNCKFESINLELMSVSCSCQVKREINMKETKPVLATMIKDSFKDSNFGIIKCYSLVFNLKTKFKNIGFLIFLVFTLIFIILYILYFIHGIKSIIVYVYQEMEKNNYISKSIHSPHKKPSKKIYIV